MDAIGFTTWKYGHEGPGYRSRQRRISAAGTLAAALLALWLFFPLGIVLLIAAAVSFFGSAKMLRLGPRYLLCGKAIVYYGNVVKVSLDEEAGRLTLQSADDRSFVLERERFPTNARKTDKIARNKAAKFGKVTGRIIERIQKASPGVEVSGFSRPAGQNE